MFVYYNSRATILRTTFVNNMARLGGGAVYFANNYWGSSIIKDCVLKLNNASTIGGAMDTNTESVVHVTTSHFDHNFASQSGGAISSSSSASTNVTDSAMTNNAAGESGARRAAPTSAPRKPRLVL